VTDQHGTAWLKAATRDAINAALGAGELDELLAGRDPDDAPLTLEQLASMSAAEIAERAQRDPHLAARLGVTSARPGVDQGARGPRPTSLLDGKSPDEVVAMLNRGDLDALLRGDT
jgi:hypothetical protein